MNGNVPALAIAVFLASTALIEPLSESNAEPQFVLQTAAAVENPIPEATPDLSGAVAECDLGRAEAILGPDDQATGRIILALAAQSCGEFSSSLDYLSQVEGWSELRDWQLLSSAKAAVALGQFPAAKAALDRLISEHVNSPLLSEAVGTSASLAQDRGDLLGLVELTKTARHYPLNPETREKLEVAAWEAGSALGDPEVRALAARRLLVDFPLKAADLGVIEDFREPEGELDWPSILTPSELTARAHRLLEVGLEEPAVDTLAEVPDKERDHRWGLVRSEAFLAAHQGEQALATLDQLQGTNPMQASDLEWRRAQSAFEAATPRPGRPLNAVQRQSMKDRGHGHLNKLINLSVDSGRVKQALRILFEDAVDDDRFEQGLDWLRQLQRIDSTDTTGARYLWRQGWKQFTARNHSGAIGYWTELADLYPKSVYNRAGSYWTGRAHESLGNRARAKQTFEEVAGVEFTDFYRRYALRRLGESAESLDTSAQPTEPIEPWPRDPLLNRAQKLFDFGLLDAASTELGALAPAAEARAVNALEALIKAAQGERRASIIAIKKSFSVLGTPYQSMAPTQARRLYYPTDFGEIIEENAGRNGLDRDLIRAMIRQESAFDPNARSWAGARGLMQLMPATGREIAKRLGLRYENERLADPAFSIRLGTSYYRQVRSMFGNDDELALAGYNAGPYRIKRLWRKAGADAEFDRFLEDLAFEETKSYVKRVLLFADSYKRLYAEAS